MVKTIIHWKKVAIHCFFGLLISAGWGGFIWGLMAIFGGPPLMFIIIGIVGGLIVGITYSSIFPKKHALYHFE